MSTPSLVQLFGEFEGFGTPAAPSITAGNNPGAIMAGQFTSDSGSTGTAANGTAIFPSLSDGEQALEELVSSMMAGGANTPSSLTTAYEGGVPSPSYASYIANGLGIGVNDTIPTATAPGSSGSSGSSPAASSGNWLDNFISSIPGMGTVSPQASQANRQNLLNTVPGLSAATNAVSGLFSLTFAQIVAVIIGIGLIIGGIFFLRPVQNATVSVVKTGKKAAALFA